MTSDKEHIIKILNNIISDCSQVADGIDNYSDRDHHWDTNDSDNWLSLATDASEVLEFIQKEVK